MIIQPKIFHFRSLDILCYMGSIHNNYIHIQHYFPCVEKTNLHFIQIFFLKFVQFDDLIFDQKNFFALTLTTSMTSQGSYFTLSDLNRVSKFS